MSKMSIKVREASAIPDKTLHTILANLKCLGKPGKAMQNYLHKLEAIFKKYCEG